MVSLPPCVWEIRTAIPFYVSFDVSLSNSQASHALSYKRNVVRTYTRSVFLHVSGIKKNCSDIRTRHLRGFFFGYFDLMQERQPELPRSRASKKARISVWEIFFGSVFLHMHEIEVLCNFTGPSRLFQPRRIKKFSPKFYLA